MRRGVRIAFDVGRVRIGVARCDAEAILAVPVLTLRRDRYGADLEEAADIVARRRGGRGPAREPAGTQHLLHQGRQALGA
mgnify:CR=1 FL=1